jgi:hypothetical protein
MPSNFELPNLREPGRHKLPPGPGRVKGLQNKITRDLKNGVMDAAILHGSDGHGEGAPTRSNRQGESTG